MASLFSGIVPVHLDVDQAIKFTVDAVNHGAAWMQDFRVGFQLTHAQAHRAIPGVQRMHMHLNSNPRSTLDMVRLREEFKNAVLRQRWPTNQLPVHEHATRKRATTVFAQRAILWVIDTLNSDVSYRPDAALKRTKHQIMKDKIAVAQRDARSAEQQRIIAQQDQLRAEEATADAVRRAAAAAGGEAGAQARLAAEQSARQQEAVGAAAALAEANDRVAKEAQRAASLQTELQRVEDELATEQANAKAEAKAEAQASYEAEVEKIKQEEQAYIAERDKLASALQLSIDEANRQQINFIAYMAQGARFGIQSMQNFQQSMVGAGVGHMLPVMSSAAASVQHLMSPGRNTFTGGYQMDDEEEQEGDEGKSSYGQ